MAKKRSKTAIVKAVKNKADKPADTPIANSKAAETLIPADAPYEEPANTEAKEQKPDANAPDGKTGCVCCAVFKCEAVKRFFKPTIVKVSLAVLIFAIFSLWLLTPVLSNVKIIPCTYIKESFIPGFDAGHSEGKCPINPAALNVSTIYFHIGFLDTCYVWVYTLILYLIFPYVAACAIAWLYSRYFGHSE
jgi:hypothetical protein